MSNRFNQTQVFMPPKRLDQLQTEVQTESQLREILLGIVDQIIPDLQEREKYILTQRYLIPQPKTLEETGAELGISGERVRQIEVKAISVIYYRIADLTNEYNFNALNMTEYFTRSPRSYNYQGPRFKEELVIKKKKRKKLS